MSKIWYYTALFTDKKEEDYYNQPLFITIYNHLYINAEALEPSFSIIVLS